jgi:antitoxin (DNA-binding transcriptional repressor) of toxin-antitoxin stability system
MKVHNITDTDLQSVVNEVTRTGEALFVGRDGTAVAKIVPIAKPACSRRLDIFAGQMTIPDDLGDWPDDEAQALGIKG